MIPIANTFDVSVLRCLSAIGGGTVAEVALKLDRSRTYVRTRLVTLAETGYVRSFGAEPRFHTYELTSTGRSVVRCAETCPGA